MEDNNLPYAIVLNRIDGNLNITIENKLLTEGKSFIEAKPFNILEEGEKIKSITTEITGYRNREAKNDDFVYITDTVTPSTWATPHIQFFTPIKIESNGSIHPIQEIFDKMKQLELPYKSNSKLLIDTLLPPESLDNNRKIKLPVIPIQQMEFKENELPQENPYDHTFNGYTNGYASISITLYNKSDDDNDLPVFFANNIYYNASDSFWK